MKDNGSEEVSPQQGEDLRDRFVPGVWRRGAALYELRYSSTGVPVFIEQSGAAFSPLPDDMERGVFTLVEPGATLGSPLFRDPEGARLEGDDRALFQLAEAAVRSGAATDPKGAARFAWRVLHELRRLKALPPEEAPQ